MPDKIKKAILLIVMFCFSNQSMAEVSRPSQDSYPYPDKNYYLSESVNIRNVNGKFYAYIVLLFSENPHFVNIIEKDSIPLKLIGNEGFHVNAYKKYTRTVSSTHIRSLAAGLLAVYLEPTKVTEEELRDYENKLESYNIILRFSRDRNVRMNKIVLDYCIYGKRSEITIKHPLMQQKERIYNIQPYIYYDEISTSNSTFYYDMIYINMEEVMNDTVIARKVMNNENVGQMFFVGSRVTEDIKYSLKRYFSTYGNDIRKHIWEMFVVHELTHKLVNNQYNYFDQVNGEELSLMSTIYDKPYLGLSVLYAYLNYNSINPHRIAVLRFLKFTSEKTGRKDIYDNPGLLKHMTETELRQLALDYFNLIISKLK